MQKVIKIEKKVKKGKDEVYINHVGGLTFI